MTMGAMLFGLATGAATASSGLSGAVNYAIPTLFYSGVGQLAYAQLFALGAPFASVLAALVLINLRYLIYATIASSWPRPENRVLRIVTPYFITETSFAMALQEPLGDRVRFLLGAGTTLWITWVVTCAIGSLLADQLPPLKHGYAIPAIVLAPILMALIKGRLRIAVAVVAFALGLALFGLPFRLGPLAAGMAAIAVVLAARAVWQRVR